MKVLINEAHAENLGVMYTKKSTRLDYHQNLPVVLLAGFTDRYNHITYNLYTEKI